MCKSINTQLTNNDAYIHAIDILYRNKPKARVVKKVIEELLELATKLMQVHNDKDKHGEKEVVEELVDVNMNLILLERYFSSRMCTEMVETKVTKFLSSKNLRKYSAHESRKQVGVGFAK